MAARIFAVLSAIFLVGAVGVAALTPMRVTLGDAALMLDSANLDWLRSHSAQWLFRWIELPLLLRPVWFLPLALGVVCAGVATTLSFGKASSTRRRRS